jgi:hypothetical protein
MKPVKREVAEAVAVDLGVKAAVAAATIAEAVTLAGVARDRITTVESAERALAGKTQRWR